jgi:hypothetical protein
MSWIDATRNLGNLHHLAKTFNPTAILEKLQDLIKDCLRHRDGTDIKAFKAERIDDMMANLEKFMRVFKLDTLDLNPIRAAWANEDKGYFDETIKAAKIQAQKSIERKEAEALAKWRKGEPVRNSFQTLALRIRGDVIETSQAAQIPVADAVAFWPSLKNWVASKVTFKDDSGKYKLGGYAVKSFDGKILTVGCHHIPVKELKLMARQLKLS